MKKVCLSVFFPLFCFFALTQVVTGQDNFGVFQEPKALPPSEALLSNTFSQKTNLPSRYDARDEGLITPVKNQQPFDLCWAHAVMSMAESNLIKKGLADTTLDLSEIQPHYFQWFSVPDEQNLISSDHNQWIPYQTSTGKQREWINSWSTGYRAVFLLSSWKGVTEEKIAPYPTAELDLSNYSLPSEAAWDNDYAHLQNAFWFASSNHELLKQMILQYGSAVLTFHQNARSFLNEEYAAYYCPQKASTNHLVNVIGWDDDFPAEYFKEKPQTNGAWLVKNSFGKNWGDHGYFWLSYDDQTVYADAFVFDFEPSDNYDHIYQYDGTVSYSYKNIPEEGEITAANVFLSQRDEDLAAVSYVSPSMNYQYEITIYTDVASEPDSGTKTAVLSGEERLPGYHTLVLPNSVHLRSGQRFSVVIRIFGTAPGKAYIMVDTSTTFSTKDTEGKDIIYQKLVNEMEPGQSFYQSANGSWVDCFGNSPDTMVGNNRIKAFTRDSDVLSIDGITNPKSVSEDLFVNQQASGRLSPSETFLQLFQLSDGSTADLPATGLSSRQTIRMTERIPMSEPTHIGLLEIPSLDISVRLRPLSRQNPQYAAAFLDTDAGLLAGSAEPGAGVCVVAAHNHLNQMESGPFLFIRNLSAGDRLFFRDTQNLLQSFIVYENILINPDDIQTASDHVREKSLILVTCEDEGIDGTYLHRRLVFARPVN